MLDKNKFEETVYEGEKVIKCKTCGHLMRITDDDRELWEMNKGTCEIIIICEKCDSGLPAKATKYVIEEHNKYFHGNKND